MDTEYSILENSINYVFRDVYNETMPRRCSLKKCTDDVMCRGVWPGKDSDDLRFQA